MKNIVENQGIKTDKPLPMSYEALKAERDALERQLSISEAKCKGYFSDAAAALIKCDALAVENAALKSGCGFFMYSPDAGFEQHKTYEDAINAALEMIDDYRSDAGDGWCEEAERVFCGVILQQAVECDHQKPSEDNGYLGSMDYKLYPATDAALAAIQAQGVEKFADDLHKVAMAMCSVKPDNTTPGAYAGMARSFAKKLREAK